MLDGAVGILMSLSESLELTVGCSPFIAHPGEFVMLVIQGSLLLNMIVFFSIVTKYEVFASCRIQGRDAATVDSALERKNRKLSKLTIRPI